MMPQKNRSKLALAAAKISSRRAQEFAELTHINEVLQINPRHHWFCVNHHMVVLKRK
jgi:hypothetical protein